MHSGIIRTRGREHTTTSGPTRRCVYQLAAVAFSSRIGRNEDVAEFERKVRFGNIDTGLAAYCLAVAWYRVFERCHALQSAAIAQKHETLCEGHISLKGMLRDLATRAYQIDESLTFPL